MSDETTTPEPAQPETDTVDSARVVVAETSVASLSVAVDPQHLRMAEALLFAAAEPLDETSLQKRLPDGIDVAPILAALQESYRSRGVQLSKIAGRWAFHTAPDLAYLLEDLRHMQKKLSRAAVETLAIVAYHQPVTRAEIEDVRGVSLSKGTLDVLIEAGWVKPSGRRRTVGKPLQYRTTDDFLIHFGLDGLDALPGMAELKAAGLLDAQPAAVNLFAEREDVDLIEDPLADDDDGRLEYLEPLIDEAGLAAAEAAADVVAATALEAAVEAGLESEDDVEIEVTVVATAVAEADAAPAPAGGDEDTPSDAVNDDKPTV